MKIKLYRNETAVTCMLVGSLDSNSAPETEQTLMKLTEETERLVLDLAELTYISSAGLRTLKGLRMAMTRKGGELVLKHTGAALMEVFEMTGIAGLFCFE